MNFIPTSQYLRELRRLGRKYPSLVADVAALIEQLESDPTMGVPLGRDCYKIRLSISSKKAGKKGGARVVTCVKIEQDTLYFLRIFDKSEQSTITDKQLTEILKEL
jgi:hypothetical protein